MLWCSGGVMLWWCGVVVVRDVVVVVWCWCCDGVVLVWWCGCVVVVVLW